MNDDDVKVQTTSDNDEENTDTKYAAGLYDDNPNKDELSSGDLNAASDNLGAGLGDDAYGTYDADDSTLPAENDNDDTETGVQEEDADNLREDQENLGDVIIDDGIEE